VGKGRKQLGYLVSISSGFCLLPTAFGLFEMLFPLPPQPMDYFERMYQRRGYRQIAGVDEV
jgi:hypothetical protein